MSIQVSIRERIPTAFSERVQTSVTASNVGREDRLVRGCIAMSLLLLGGFTLLGARHLTLITVAFLIFGGYFVLTAVLGSDPGYQRAGIDTRTDAELHEGAGAESVMNAESFLRAAAVRSTEPADAVASSPVVSLRG